ncbi:MAG: S41 family peptidase [Deltaproteobacteria bacterium]|nr:S41 family peptidase [Deltaproteobacteria bacterium]MBW2594730.1 S41 family peptidase [Deltaproteobacteria bacterium]MBW2649887.1 S41 family peptidase [Deltaproteobacteria bacterium]
MNFNKKRGLFLPALLAFTILILSVGHNAALATDSETYKNLKLFNEVLNLVEKNYVEDVDPKVVIHGAINGMIKSLDPHSAFMTAEQYHDLQVDTKGAFSGLGIVITMQDDMITVVSPIEDKPAFIAGVKAGDRIIRIDGKTTKDFTIMDAVHSLRGKKGTKVTITIIREGEDNPIDFDIVRDIIEIKSVKQKTYSGDIGYIRISNFQETTADELNKAFKEINAGDVPLKGLVLDLRNNPGGLLDQSVKVSDAFLKSGAIVSSRGRTKSSKRVYEAMDDGDEPECPIVVLINGGTASAAEIVSGALRDNKRAILLGTQTFGKGSVQTIVPLKDGSALKLTIAKYYTPDGESIQARGIIPDIAVEYAKPVAADEDKLKQIREKDLKGHIKGAKEEGKDDRTDKEMKDLRKDNQLKSAIDLLRSWDIFKKI